MWNAIIDVKWSSNYQTLFYRFEFKFESAQFDITMLSPSSTQPRRHCQAGYSFAAVLPWPLQCRSCGFATDDTRPSTESLACSSIYCFTLKSRRPCHSCFAEVALIADHRESTIQSVPACAQDVRQACSRLHCQAVDIHSRSSLRSSSNCDLVVPRTSWKIGDKAFSVTTPRAWNWLPTGLSPVWVPGTVVIE